MYMFPVIFPLVQQYNTHNCWTTCHPCCLTSIWPVTSQVCLDNLPPLSELCSDILLHKGMAWQLATPVWVAFGCSITIKKEADSIHVILVTWHVAKVTTACLQQQRVKYKVKGQEHHFSIRQVNFNNIRSVFDIRNLLVEIDCYG